jgi:hypothetical protein
MAGVTDDVLMQLKALEKDVKTITFYSRTQAVADLTGYRGFADWAEVMVSRFLPLISYIYFGS